MGPRSIVPGTGKSPGYGIRHHLLTGGRGGIRTHGTLSGTPVFKTGGISLSPTLPGSLDLYDKLP